MEEKEGGGGAGGKLRGPPSRRPPATPYNRPQQHGRWLSKLVDPARHLIKGLPSLFSPSSVRRRQPHAESEQKEEEEEEDERDVGGGYKDGGSPIEASVPAAKGNAGTSAVVGDVVRSSPEPNMDEQVREVGPPQPPKVSEIEQLLSGRSFSRDEIQKLIGVLHSKSVDREDSSHGRVEVLDAAVDTSHERVEVLDAAVDSSHERVEVLDAAVGGTLSSSRQSICDVGNSPVDIARVHMISRSSGAPVGSPGITKDDRALVSSSDMPSQRHKDILGDGGPSDRTLLKRQEVHRSQAIWNAEISDGGDSFDMDAVLKIYRRRWKQKPVQNMAFIGYMQAVGFWDVWRIGHVVIEPAVITALVERWRPETHTFHMPVGEMTITLQDVAVLYGLPIDGIPLTGQQSPPDWQELCMQYFGRNPKSTPGSVVGNAIVLRWFEDIYDPSDLPDDATDETVRQFVRASIMRLIGCILFPETSESRVSMCWLPMLLDFDSIVTYSWGSACLSHLYNQLCRATDQTAFSISGDLALVCMWAAERIIPLRVVIKNPMVQEYGQALGIRWTGIINRRISKKCMIVTEYRRKLDKLRDEDVIWLPYTEAIIDKLPVIVHRDRHLWLVRVPLISFYCVEWHYPDRVFRQFGYVQGVPLPPEPDEGTHSASLGGRGQARTKWDDVFPFHVKLWKELRHNYVCPPGLPTERLYVHYHDSYMDWYRLHTRLFISHAGAMIHRNADAIEHIWHSTQGDPQMRSLSEAALRFLGEERRYTEIPQSQLPLPQPPTMVYNIPASERVPVVRRRQNMFSKRSKISMDAPAPEFEVRPMQWRDYQSKLSEIQQSTQEL